MRDLGNTMNCDCRNRGKIISDKICGNQRNFSARVNDNTCVNAVYDALSDNILFIMTIQRSDYYICCCLRSSTLSVTVTHLVE